MSSSNSGGVNLISSANTIINERSVPAGIDFEYATDPATGGFFSTDYKKHEDLKQMLDSNKDNLKLEAMKRIIGMVAKGRDASDLFPAVVKNVVSKNIEVKKLVYVYLVRYAEDQQDLALLSISTFQRALKDPNQLIRASALRVLSSIRVSMIVPIVMLAIRESASDMSPYVRKTAAHAIPKLYSLDSEQKEELVMIIEKLLSDKTTLVVGSAVMAFEDVCPERVDLIHKNYRKLCNLLVDVDEWGQVIIINMLTRYARTQFIDPNLDEIDDENSNKPFYDSTSEDDSKINDNNLPQNKSTYSLDLDHRLLLRQTKPLLQSRNASVVMAVAQLYHHIAPRNDVQTVAKALIRLLRSHTEVQSVVLTCIASMSLQRKIIFEPYMKSFFVRISEPTHIKLLKLEILTNLATEASISVILREFQTYISSNDRDFVAATIQAIGRCAASIKEVTETCLSGLVQLLSNRDEYVVAESVVVIKKLLQTQPSEHKDIISQMGKLLDFITVAPARAAIIWLIGEYNDLVAHIAPDVLRKIAKNFIEEEDVVKLQVLNLAAKLFLVNPSQTAALCIYVFNLARYDCHYDIRDRARFLKQIIFPASGKPTVLSLNAKKIFLASKPAPTLESKHYDRGQFQLGSLSHYLNMRTVGYHDLPTFPEVASDSTLRNIEDSVEILIVDDQLSDNHSNKNINSTKKSNTFYSESEKSSSEYDSHSSLSTDDSESSSSSDSDSESEIEQKERKLYDIKYKSDIVQNNNPNNVLHDSDDSVNESTIDSDKISSDNDIGTSNDTSSAEDETYKMNFEKAKNFSKQNTTSKTQDCKSNLDLLLEMDDATTLTPIMTPSLGGFLSSSSIPENIELVGPTYISLNSQELLNKVNGYGLSINYRFTRSPHLFSSTMLSIELLFTNHNTIELTNIRIGEKKLLPGMLFKDFTQIDSLGANKILSATIGIDFNDSTQPVNFEIKSNIGVSQVALKAPVGELIRSVKMTEELFKTERKKLRGMTEHATDIELIPELCENRNLQKKIFEIANVFCIPSFENGLLQFASQTMTSKSLVLIKIVLKNSVATVTVNCELMVFGSMLLNEIKASLIN